MKDQAKTKQTLIKELVILREKIGILERGKSDVPLIEHRQQQHTEGPERGSSESNKILVSGINVAWDVAQGTCTFEGIPVAMMWVDTTLAGLMSGVQAMVGTDRFFLALQSEGRKSVEADWQVISQYPDFHDGFKAIANIAAVAGWGYWELTSLNTENRECCFRIGDSWEGRYQKSLGVCWGSGMLAGKVAGYCTKLFETNCWADQTQFIAKGDTYDEFVVKPSPRLIENEIENLLASDEATRADMAVILRKLEKEITERKQAEETLLQSEERFRNMANLLPQTVFETDEKGNFTFINRQGFEMFGYNEADNIAGMSVLETIIPQDRDRAVENINRHIRGVEFPAQEYTAIRRDGSTFPAAIYASPSIIHSTYAGMRGMLIDITERKRAEENVRESERRFKSIVEHITDIFYMMDANHQILYISPQVEQSLGYPIEELKSNWRNHRTDNPMNAVGHENSQRAFMTGEKQPPYLQEFMHRDGTKRLAEMNESPIKNDKGEVIGMVGAARDITERKRIESALKESEEKYRMVVENAMEAITISVDGMIKFANSRAAKMGGYSQEELTSGSFLKFVHPDDHQMVTNYYLMHLQGTDVPNKYSFRIICKPGDIKWVDVTGALITWKGKPAILNFLNDITDRKRLEEEQQRVEKLESVGVLAGGIAHDFNNILTAILGNISLAGMEAQEGSELHGSLEEAQKAVLRAKDLTKQLLTFSRGGAPVMKLSSLTELLKDTSDFALRGSNVKCEFSIPDDLWHADIDAGQVSQVIHNLVINAQQAMPEGGTIELTAQNIALSETRRLGKGLPLKKGNYVRIAVTDHGSGIPAQHMDRIFDPFFTTKQKGSGLGLATSFSIARQHGGHLSAVSTPNSGSTFYLYLPASRAKSTPRPDDKIETKPAGKARILVMDDEKGVREVAGRMLRHVGYRDIEFAADGAEAIKLYKAAMESGNPFTVAILDLTIPGGMGGKMTVKKLRKIDPGVKAIVSSGYVDDSVISKYKEYGFSGMVAKPYTIEELRKALQDAIG